MKKILIILLAAVAFSCQEGKKSDNERAGTDQEQTDERKGNEAVTPDTTDQTEAERDTTNAEGIQN